jgi:hypothetical protein
MGKTEKAVFRKLKEWFEWEHIRRTVSEDGDITAAHCYVAANALYRSYARLSKRKKKP